MQVQMEFETQSPINWEKLTSQNADLYRHLMTGKRINRMQADILYGIGNLHSRISDLRNVHKIEIKDRFVTVSDRWERQVKVKEYWIEKEGATA